MSGNFNIIHVFDAFDEIFEQMSKGHWPNWEISRGGSPFERDYPSFPPSNVKLKEDKTIVFEFAVAGYPEKNIDLNFTGDALILKLNREEKEEEKVSFLKKGIKNSTSETRYYIPSNKYKTEEALANLKDGILTIEIPAKEPPKSKKLEIKKDS
jgi:HSP20 family molecular chaperone IbpA